MHSIKTKIVFIGKPSNVSGGAEKYFYVLVSDLKKYLANTSLTTNFEILFFNPISILIFIRLLFAKNVLFVFNISVLFQSVPLLLIATLFGKKTAILPHVVASPILMNPRYIYIRQFLYHLNSFLPSTIFCISDGNRSQLTSLPLVSLKKLTTIYNYVSIRSKNISPICELSSPLRIALIGRLQNVHKGQIDLIRSNSEFFRNSDLLLSLYGDGPDSKQIKSLVSQYCLTQKVVLHGHVSSSHIYEYHDFPVVLCYSYWEGLPLNLLESYCYGRIVIGRDIPGVSEIIYPRFLFSSDHELRNLIFSLPDLLKDSGTVAEYTSFVNFVLNRYNKKSAMDNLMSYFSSNRFS